MKFFALKCTFKCTIDIVLGTMDFVKNDEKLMIMILLQWISLSLEYAVWYSYTHLLFATRW